MSVVIFAPAPILTITVEAGADEPDVHIHAGGQGVWQARMLLRLGVDVTLACALTGESGDVLRHLLENEGIRVRSLDRAGRGAVYIHDRRDGERRALIESPGDPITRHDLDELYGIALGAALDAELVILSGPAGDDVLPAEVYRRLSADLAHAGIGVVVDLAGDRLEAAIDGGAALVKVSDEELLRDGRVAEDDLDSIIAAMGEITARGVGTVIVTRAEQPFIVRHRDELWEVTPPAMEVVDHRGAGDSLTAGVCAALSRGQSMREAVVLGAAAGALNVTRHGLGTGDAGTIDRLRDLVGIRSLGTPEGAGDVSPDELARKVEQA